MTPFPKLADLKAGDKLKADAGFTCLCDGEVTTVESDEGGLFVRCSAGEGDYGQPATALRDQRHYLDGQEGDDGECVGMYRV